MLIALGTEAAMAGLRVTYVLATKLVDELVEAADEKQPAKTTGRCVREVIAAAADEAGSEDDPAPPGTAVTETGRPGGEPPAVAPPAPDRATREPPVPRLDDGGQPP